ncbi:MAG: hypothetical protein JNJ92_01220 [Altererythrobacter sp.]|nr:hypothetical protein [Altererythrobacter sp.]
MLIRSVETFLRRHAMSPTMFGREAAQDARLVADMRNGREPRSPLDQRLRGFMEGFDFARSQAATPAQSRQETPDAR